MLPASENGAGGILRQIVNRSKQELQSQEVLEEDILFLRYIAFLAKRRIRKRETMLNQRQIEILLELCENHGRYMTASYFADKQQVSSRTIQTDMKQLKDILATEDFLEFQSAVPHGRRIVVKDLSAFSEYKERLYQKLSNTAVNYQDERINQILVLLLNQRRAISLYELENTAFVSQSTLQSDLKRVSEVLEKYDLELMRGASKVSIDGSEINKRRCISEEKLLAISDTSSLQTEDYDLKTKIKNILVETFVSFKHMVSEVMLNNSILFLEISLRRIKNYFLIEPGELEITEDIAAERAMAAEVFRRIEDTFYVRVPKTEIDYYAVYIRGQSSETPDSMISEEIDTFVLNALRGIRKTFGLDLTDDLNLRIDLSLHCTSLIVRMKYQMQLQNHMVNYIRQTYPQGFDIASYFASLLQKEFHHKVSDEEIAFIAIHIYRAVVDQQRNSGTKRLLVISSLRRSENTLLRQTLVNWFSDQIAELSFVPPESMDESYLDRYDTFVTTEKGKYYDMGLAIYINPFPNKHDYLNLKLAIDGFRNIDDILNIFQRDLFVHVAGAGKQDILRTLCKNAAASYDLDARALEEAVMEREHMRSTFFGNAIAAPHPMSAISSDTFVCVAVSQEPVEWDSSHNKANLVMLIGVGKNNAKAFQLWNYLSKLFMDQHFVERLLPSPSYGNFLKLLKDAITDDFKT